MGACFSFLHSGLWWLYAVYGSIRRSLHAAKQSGTPSRSARSSAIQATQISSADLYNVIREVDAFDFLVASLLPGEAPSYLRTDGNASTSTAAVGDDSIGPFDSSYDATTAAADVSTDPVVVQSAAVAASDPSSSYVGTSGSGGGTSSVLRPSGPARRLPACGVQQDELAARISAAQMRD